MSFLFKSKSKNAPPPPSSSQQPPSQGLPNATRNLHTSDGTTSSGAPSIAPKLEDRKAQSPPPNVGVSAGSAAGANGSLNSLTGPSNPPLQAPLTGSGPAPGPGTGPAPGAPAASNGPGGPNAPFARRDRAGSELGVRNVARCSGISADHECCSLDPHLR